MIKNINTAQMEDGQTYFYVDFIDGNHDNVHRGEWYKTDDPTEFGNAMNDKGLAFMTEIEAAVAAKKMLTALTVGSTIPITFTREQVMQAFGLEEIYADSLILMYDPRRVQYALDNDVDLCDLDRWEWLIILFQADRTALADTLTKLGYPVSDKLGEDVCDYVKAQHIINYLYEKEDIEIMEYNLKLQEL